MMKMYHNPVLLNESVKGLKIIPDGTYVDVTYGGGGHSKVILQKLGPKGRLIAFDQDRDAHKNKIDDNRLKLIESNFKFLNNHLNYLQISQVDGLLADFGISSYQIDTKTRGFSIRFDSKLDMRMDQLQKMDAKFIINKYDREKLENIFQNYGELRNYRRIVDLIVSERKNNKINTSGDLKRILEPLSISSEENKFLAKVFQAIRIEVNDEINIIKSLLVQSSKILKKGGRLVCISYHSLEDRLVKRFIQNGTFESDAISDIYGNKDLIFKKIGKLISPDKEEVGSNNRSRSARLRVAEKI
ncbi:MAG TPA: 16S rRNA (cytosine(1402)-N(4))-methyltransferase RsmH [Flavobacteriaceae bacterium]|jgi:16S rRNA (cytosine1402-N4)-methyltransferase|nr:16S rRNA (cytosine(1402)-N(4))-methyltransferase RsmH [Flavobacteriaceae bacterium]HJO70861.1 16S rRNA (cytosine(1402)-N(4))-methyltransferase RsmH [Flavobacteriaceae bacterium]|tara:strand:- start:5814 stop:6716 length:903 start_codon:yes stop_codon:yes gene_type:complete